MNPNDDKITFDYLVREEGKSMGKQYPVLSTRYPVTNHGSSTLDRGKKVLLFVSREEPILSLVRDRPGRSNVGPIPLD